MLDAGALEGAFESPPLGGGAVALFRRGRGGRRVPASLAELSSDDPEQLLPGLGGQRFGRAARKRDVDSKARACIDGSNQQLQASVRDGRRCYGSRPMRASCRGLQRATRSSVLHARTTLLRVTYAIARQGRLMTPHHRSPAPPRVRFSGIAFRARDRSTNVPQSSRKRSVRSTPTTMKIASSVYIESENKASSLRPASRLSDYRRAM